MNKQEFLMWRDHPITQLLLEGLKVGKEAALEGLVSGRGEVGDFERGAIAQCEEAISMIRTGDLFNIQEED